MIQYHFTFRGRRIPRCVASCSEIAEQMGQTPSDLQLILDSYDPTAWFDREGKYLGDDANGIGVEAEEISA